MRRIGAVALAAVLAVGLGACGGDDDDDGVALEDVDQSDGSSDDSSDDTTDDTADDSSDDSSDDSTDDTDIDLGAFGSEECQEIFGALSGIGSAFGDSEEFDFGNLAEVFDAIDAPEIEDDLGVLADAYRQLDDALGDTDLSDPSAFTSPEFQEAAEALNTEEFTSASERVGTFMEDVCGTTG